jgi:A/G-specific adenine glycosylase
MPDTPLFAAVLLDWYRQYRRDLPWRRTADPYRIWLSEVILQQTRVQQGLPYYERFVEAFPTVFDLAQAPEETVLRHWQGLGYYSRARNLHRAAQQVAAAGGAFPGSFEALRRLPGVGDYTAAAIASFAFGEAVAVVDGNVFRVLSRVFGVEEDIASPAGKKAFQALAQGLLPADAGTYNQAIMEFGALQCKPAGPDCGACPLADLCEARRQGRVGELPVKSKKAKVRNRHLYYFVCHEGGRVAMRRRGGGDVWQGLYDFPCWEPEAAAWPEAALEQLPGGAAGWKDVRISGEKKHILTHQRIFARFLALEAESADFLEAWALGQGLELVPFSELEARPKPVLITAFLEEMNWLAP